DVDGVITAAGEHGAGDGTLVGDLVVAVAQVNVAVDGRAGRIGHRVVTAAAADAAADAAAVCQGVGPVAQADVAGDGAVVGHVVLSVAEEDVTVNRQGAGVGDGVVARADHVAVNGAVVLERVRAVAQVDDAFRSEEHTSELQSRENLVCRLLLEKKNNNGR